MGPYRSNKLIVPRDTATISRCAVDGYVLWGYVVLPGRPIAGGAGQLPLPEAVKGCRSGPEIL